ncbi:Asp-tRNA(Asn)/Glu-tRNA(Gln) amidotransferase subunit GatB [Candidatus Saccharibacteria bacterium]|nr:Asp-tRNA(Asn)/Glu-tRNA(Gln) amidotransferase subunit GatB [Candidatus Saccharibacteria bacterium]
MINDDIRKKYLPTIGIECHVQLKTKTKLFAAVDNDSRGKEPNTTVSPICFGLPGTLPVLNNAAIDFGIKAGLALNAKINPVISFDRKHYFYPDLPKGYQITQMYQPIVLEGYVDLPGLDKKVKIHHAHLEEDAGKNTHPAGADYSLVDYNRAGTPLLEIVSEPDMHSAVEAKAFAHELYLLMKYSGVSDVDLYHGNMRFDVNVSVAPVGSDELGTRAEVKNLNSFKSVERASLYEIDRQIELLEKGIQIDQETRGWDDAKQSTSSQRGKEFAHDYRYMPEPDVPPVEISQKRIDNNKSQMPLLPGAIRDKLAQADLSTDQIETLLNQKQLLDILLEIIDQTPPKAVKKIANWLNVDVQGYIAEQTDYDLDSIKLTGNNLIKLEALLSESKLSSSAAKEVLYLLLKEDKDPEVLAKDNNLLQVSDSSEIEKIVDEVIASNESAAQDVRNGETKAIGFLVGQVMKASKGQANPSVVSKLLNKKLE